MKLGLTTQKIRSPFFDFANDGSATAFAAECFIAAAEIVLIFLSLRIPLPPILAADLLLLSPLKIGRALLYDTLVSDPSSASFGLLFRYYRTRYFKTILWRISLWTRLSLTAFLLSLPSFLVRLYEQYTVDTHLRDALSFLNVSLLVCGIFILCCALLFFTPSSFLLIYTRDVKSVFRLQKRVFGNTFALLSSSYEYLLKRLPFFVLCMPYVIAKWRIQQAHLIREKIEEFLAKETSANLERFKNM